MKEIPERNRPLIRAVLQPCPSPIVIVSDQERPKREPSRRRSIPGSFPFAPCKVVSFPMRLGSTAGLQGPPSAAALLLHRVRSFDSAVNIDIHRVRRAIEAIVDNEIVSRHDSLRRLGSRNSR